MERLGAASYRYHDCNAFDRKASMSPLIYVFACSQSPSERADYLRRLPRAIPPQFSFC